ncbi:MAG: LamG domain-containing protein [Bacteroidia bacterium]|nr:LamG domain-containing protein [Bacteroidia bacterium]
MNHHFSLSATLAALLLICLPGLLQAQNALNFDGTNDFVQTTYSGVLGSADRTFEAWINVAPGSAANNAILDYGLNAVGSRNTFLINPNNQVAFISGGTNANISSSINAIIPGQWTHVAFVLNSGTGFFYVNGVQVGTGSLTSVNTPGGNATLRIGQRVSGGSIPFEGEIDEVRIWNYARTAAEIMNDMNAEFCAPQTGLMAYYQFNEGVAGGTNTGVTTAPDFSGNGNNGTLTNFSLSGASSNWVSGVTI